MKYAIIAAGDGSRLAQEGVKAHKPLVRLNGEPMIDRLIRVFTALQATEIVLIVNAAMPEVVNHVREVQHQREHTSCPLRVVVKSTPSSMHSFFEISRFLEDGPFCLTTVDTIFREEEFAAYIRSFSDGDSDGLMAVTDFIDDEKPLYVGTDSGMRVTGFYDEPHGCRFISGGIYCLRPVTLKTLHGCMEAGQSRMRNFQRQMVEDGCRLQAFPFRKILDVDHADDIAKAEAFLNGK